MIVKINRFLVFNNALLILKDVWHQMNIMERYYFE